MSLVVGEATRNQEERTQEQSRVTVKEIAVYSGEKCVLACTGTIEALGNGAVKIMESNGNVSTVYNGVVVVREKSKNFNAFKRGTDL